MFIFNDFICLFHDVFVALKNVRFKKIQLIKLLMNLMIIMIIISVHKIINTMVRNVILKV